MVNSQQKTSYGRMRQNHQANAYEGVGEGTVSVRDEPLQC